jgi:malate synthase
VLDGRDTQLDRRRDDVEVTAEQLLDAASAGDEITDEGLRGDVNVGIRYIASWLAGNGAAAIDNLMEDAATAEIARSQVWQWVRHGVELDSGETVSADLVRRYAAEVDAPPEARELFEQVALSEKFADFLTLPAYERLD